MDANKSKSAADSFFIKTSNNYHYYDYNKQIIPIKNDMRTTYDFGHRNQVLNDRIGPPNVSIPDVCRVLAAKEINYAYSTETGRQYYAKAPSTFDQKAERAMAATRPHFAKSAEDRIFRRPPKNIDRFHSQYQRDYVVPLAEVAEGSAGSPTTNNGLMPYRSPAASEQKIFAHQPGHYKYLDPYATTNMLAHPQHSVEQQNGIGRKDCVTLWDWFEYPKGKGYGLQFYPVKQRGPVEPMQDRLVFKLMMKDRLIPNERLPVPNNGMRSEQRTEYGFPIPLSVCIAYGCFFFYR